MFAPYMYSLAYRKVLVQIDSITFGTNPNTNYQLFRYTKELQFMEGNL